MRRAPFKLGKLKFNHITQALQISLIITLLASFFFATRIEGLEGVSPVSLLINAAIAIVVSMVIEILFLRSRGRWTNLKDCYLKQSPLLIPLTVVLLLPIHATWFIVVIATIMAVWIGKLVYGGFGYSIFNAAIVGVLFANLSFKSSLVSPEGIAYPIEMLKLASQSNQIALLSQQSLFIGGTYFTIGAGAMSGLVLAVLFIVLAALRVIDWRLTVTYLATVFGITYIMGGSYYAMEHLLSGLVLFTGVFLITDPVTTPTSRETKLVFAVIVGLLTVMIRVLGNNTEGVLFAVLLGNIFTPYINRTARQSNTRSFIKTIVFVIALIVLGGLAIGFINSPAEVAEFVATGVNF